MADQDDALDRLNQRLDVLSLKLDRQTLQMQAPPAEKKQAWWVTAIQFLGLPAAVVAIVMQTGQTAQMFESKEKTAAEARKVEAEAEKIRVESEKLRLELKEQQAKLAKESVSGAQVDATLNNIRATLASLDEMERRIRNERAESLLRKFIILWAAVWAIGLVFDIFTQLWSILLNSVTASIFMNRRHDGGERHQRLVRRISIVLPVMHQIPSLLRWAVQLSVLITLVGPVFDGVAQLNGADVTFRDVIRNVATAQFSTAIGQLARAMGA